MTDSRFRAITLKENQFFMKEFTVSRHFLFSLDRKVIFSIDDEEMYQRALEHQAIVKEREFPIKEITLYLSRIDEERKILTKFYVTEEYYDQLMENQHIKSYKMYETAKKDTQILKEFKTTLSLSKEQSI